MISMNNQIIQAESTDNDKFYKWKALITVAMGMLMCTMDFSIANIAFPTFTKTFKTTLPTVIWITQAYSLTSTSSILILGKVSDLLGRKKIYSLGILTICVGLVSSSLSQTIGQLIFFRIIQALGAAMVVSTAVAIVVEAFPPQERGKGMGLLSIFAYIGFIIGPVIGGMLLNWVDWRAIFFMRIPFALIILIMSITFLKKDIKAKGTIHLDLRGALISSLMIFCLIFGISQVHEYGFKSPLVILLISISLLLFIIFILVESHTKDPIIDLKLFKNHVFSGALWSLFLCFVSYSPLLFILPFYLIQGVGTTPAQAGLILSVPAILSMVSGPISGGLSDRVNPAWLMTLGAILITISFCLLLFFELNTPLFVIILVLALEGVAIGAFEPPTNSIVMGNVPKNQLGTASALISTFRQIGIAVGMAITGTLYATRDTVYKQNFSLNGFSPADAERMAIPPAFHDVLIFSIIVGIVVMFLCIFTGKSAEMD